MNLLFQMRRPRRFHHEPIYSDGREPAGPGGMPREIRFSTSRSRHHALTGLQRLLQGGGTVMVIVLLLLFVIVMITIL